MQVEFTEKELEIVQRLVYNELIRQKYISKVNETEMPSEYLSLIEKLKESEQDVS